MRYTHAKIHICYYVPGAGIQVERVVVPVEILEETTERIKSSFSHIPDYDMNITQPETWEYKEIKVKSADLEMLGTN